MGPNVIYRLSCALGVVLMPSLLENDFADWRCLETACVCHVCQVSGKIGGLKPVRWMGLASVAVLAPMFEQTLAIEIE